MVTSSSRNMTFESTAGTTLSSVLPGATSTDAEGLTTGNWILIGGGIVAFFGVVVALCVWLCGNNVVPRCRKWIWISKKDRKAKAADKRPKGKDVEKSDENTSLMMEIEQGTERRYDAADRCEAKLKEVYTTTGSFVQTLSWADDKKRHITKIYTKLQLQSGEGDMQCIEGYQDIFTNGDKLTKAVFVGDPGRGKTTLFDKIAYDWATCPSVLGKYKLCILLRMYALDQASDLTDAIFDQLLAKDSLVDKTALKTYINNKPRTVLLLLDGFDEFQSNKLTEANFGSILSIMNRSLCRECTVLVTTRPSHYETMTQKLIKQPFAHVNVLGFSSDDIGTYIEQFYSEVGQHDEAENLIKRIGSSNALSDLASSPMLLPLMCLLWDKYNFLPEILYGLYNKAMEYIFKRKGMKTEEIDNVIIAIGETALYGLIADDQKLEFQESDFEDGNAMEEALQAGILTSQRVLKGIGVYQKVHFIHKTFQEFSAAKYFQHVCGQNSDQCKEILSKLENPEKFEYFLRFCCGNDSLCTKHVLERLQKFPLEGKTLQLALNAYFESQTEDVISADFVEAVLCREMKIVDFTKDAYSSLSWFMVHVSNLKDPQHKVYLANVHTMHVMHSATCPLSSILPTKCVTAMTNLSTFKTTDCTVHFDDKILAKSIYSLSAVPKLTKLSLNKSHLFDTCLWAAYLEQLRHLKTLKLIDCHLRCHEIEPIAQSLSKIETFTKLDLSYNLDLVLETKVWSRSLICLRHLQTLKLASCGLECKAIEHIAESLSKIETFTKLDLTDNDDLWRETKVWSRRLICLRHLKTLKLNYCCLEGRNIKHIAESLSKIETFTKLDLSGNFDLRLETEVWPGKLICLHHLKTLKLAGIFQFDEAEKRAVTEALKEMKNLDIVFG